MLRTITGRETFPFNPRGHPVFCGRKCFLMCEYIEWLTTGLSTFFLSSVPMRKKYPHDVIGPLGRA